jgi:hypothetical protein
MNNTFVNQIAIALTSDLQAFAAVCEEVLSLATREHQSLSGHGEYRSTEFYEKRKTLLPNIELLLQRFRNHRMTWQQISQAQREQFEELKQLFQDIQGLLMRVIQLDRENQQAMLKRGLVPVKHLPAAAGQRPHFVANLYQRNSAGREVTQDLFPFSQKSSE